MGCTQCPARHGADRALGLAIARDRRDAQAGASGERGAIGAGGSLARERAPGEIRLARAAIHGSVDSRASRCRARYLAVLAGDGGSRTERSAEQLPAVPGHCYWPMAAEQDKQLGGAS